MTPAARPGPAGSVLVVTGTGTGVGKTVVTAAVAASALAAGLRVAVLKPAQTGAAEGEPGDVHEVVRLAGPVTGVELARYPEPLAPGTAARRSGLPPLRPADAASAAANLAADHDLVLVEGAGGLLVDLDGGGGTLADVAAALDAPVLVTTAAGLGTLNATALTTEALARRGLACAGAVIGAWPGSPGLASLCNLADLPATCGNPLVGALPEGAAALRPEMFRRASPGWLAPALHGTWDQKAFSAANRPAGYTPHRTAPLT